MSLGTPDTGDSNRFAAGRIARFFLILLVLFMSLSGLGRLTGVLPAFADLLVLRKPAEGGGVVTAAGTGGGIAAAGGGKVSQLLDRGRSSLLGKGGPATTAEAREVVSTLIAMRQAIDALPAAEKAAAEAVREKLAAEVLRARMEDYLAAPAAQKRAVIDRHIRQDELMRQAWRISRSFASVATAGTGFPGGRGGPAIAGATGSGTDDDRNRQWKKFIDTTSPQQRARYQEYGRAMDERRLQMGLPLDAG